MSKDVTQLQESAQVAASNGDLSWFQEQETLGTLDRIFSTLKQFSEVSSSHPLHFAIVNNHASLTEWILSRIDLQIATANRCLSVAIRIVSQNGNLELLKLLLESLYRKSDFYPPAP